VNIKKIIRRSIPEDINLPDSFHPVLKRVYAARNIKTAEELDYSLASLLPFNILDNIDVAVALLKEALEKQNRILIVADFDADGATSCALMIRGLSMMGINDIVYVVPNRFEYGYGLTPEIVDVALDYEPDLLITVDNGISSVEGVKRAKENGVKVLITDHHLPGENLPEADAIVNPQLKGDLFPSKNLAGVGVVFYILLALRAELREGGWFEQKEIAIPNLAKLLDIVALGTVADVVPLDKNNRTMVAHGLKLIKQNKSIPGITAILEQSGRSLTTLSASDLGFSIAPKLNAAGRLTDMSLGIECLLTDDISKAKTIARQLNELNIERRQIQDDMQEQAMFVLEEYLKTTSGEVPLGLSLYDPEWHQGVIGILAAKVKDTFNRPVIAFAREGDGKEEKTGEHNTEESNTIIKGSARSIHGLHIRDLLEGISSVEGVKRAKENGVKVLITDHHLPGENLPEADAIVNPQLKGDLFPSKNLAGVGVVFYILLALRAELREGGWFEQKEIAIPNLAKLLDIVALGTVADVVPLDKNNRTMVAHGLKLIKQNKSIPGITAILEQSGRSLTTLSASDLGFSIAPKLNAAGRLTDMSLGIECLLTDDISKAKTIARQLNELNIERRQIQDDMQEQAMFVLEEYLKTTSGEVPLGLSLYDPEWHQGVIGILAAKVKDTFNRPVIAFAREGDGKEEKTGEHNTEESNTIIKGSARSIHGLHIRDLLEDITRLYPDLILTFGGHAMAAGLTIKESEFERFSKCFVNTLKDHISLDEMQDECLTDGELSSNDLSIQLAQFIQMAGPWGQHFPEPVFEGQFKVMDKSIVGENHLKLKLQIDGNNRIFDAIAFNTTDEGWPLDMEEVFSTYRLGINEFRGNSQLQLFIEHIEPV
jgi:single-stranded-DNA-specific exonuclease